MTAQQFAYWLQGFAELNGAPPNGEQWHSIMDHLQTVFTKVTPVGPGQELRIGQWPQSISELAFIC